MDFVSAHKQIKYIKLKLNFTVTNRKNGHILQNGQMRFFMASAVKKMAKFFESGHEMALLATL